MEPCRVGTQIFEGDAQLAADGASGGCQRGIVELRPRPPQGTADSRNVRKARGWNSCSCQGEVPGPGHD